METQNNNPVRIGTKMIEYIKKVQELFKKEYNLHIASTEISNLIAERAEKNDLF